MNKKFTMDDLKFGDKLQANDGTTLIYLGKGEIPNDGILFVNNSDEKYLYYAASAQGDRFALSVFHSDGVCVDAPWFFIVEGVKCGIKQAATIDAWIARDKDGKLFLFEEEPIKCTSAWMGDRYFRIDCELFQEVRWEDKEPKKVKVTIELCD